MMSFLFSVIGISECITGFEA